MTNEEAQEQIAAIIERDTNAASGDAYDAAGGILAEVVAKIKADTLREAAIQVVTQVGNVEADETGDEGPHYHGATYGMRKTAQWLHRRADRIEEDA